MKMCHPDSNFDIDVHPSRVEEMKRKGWSETTPSEVKADAQAEAVETLEEINDGKS